MLVIGHNIPVSKKDLASDNVLSNGSQKFSTASKYACLTSVVL